MQLATIPTGTLAATFIGILAAAVMWTALSGTPIFGSDRAALVTLVVMGFAMCIAGGWGSTGTIPSGPTSIIAGFAGALTLVVLGAVIFGWTAILDPVSGVIYGKASGELADKVGIVAVGVLIAIAWFMATLRQIGLVGGATAG